MNELVIRTRKVPRVIFVDVDLFDEFDRERFVVDLATEVEVDELFVGRVEAEPWKRELGVVVAIIVDRGHVGELWGTIGHYSVLRSSWFGESWGIIGGKGFSGWYIYINLELRRRGRCLNIYLKVKSVGALTSLEWQKHMKDFWLCFSFINNVEDFVCLFFF